MGRGDLIHTAKAFGCCGEQWGEGWVFLCSPPSYSAGCGQASQTRRPFPWEGRSGHPELGTCPTATIPQCPAPAEGTSLGWDTWLGWMGPQTLSGP